MLGRAVPWGCRADPLLGCPKWGCGLRGLPDLEGNHAMWFFLAIWAVWEQDPVLLLRMAEECRMSAMPFVGHPAVCLSCSGRVHLSTASNWKYWLSSVKPIFILTEHRENACIYNSSREHGLCSAFLN